MRANVLGSPAGHSKPLKPCIFLRLEAIQHLSERGVTVEFFCAQFFNGGEITNGFTA
jgi:hypothetical protein